MISHDKKLIPIWSFSVPATAALLLVANYFIPGISKSFASLVVASFLLGATVFSAVHHAEVIALRVGEPLGAIVLALSVTLIEVALIVSILFSDASGHEEIARDTVFSAVMIVLNGIIGFCLVVGARRYKEQAFQLQGAVAALAVLGTLVVLAMLLPNYTISTPGPYYSTLQLVFVGVVSLILYSVFLLTQTVLHRNYFVEGPSKPAPEAAPNIETPSNATTLFSGVLLIIALIAVVALAKVLSYPISSAISYAGLEPSFLGVIIAALVLTPEGLASVRAALSNRLQDSIIYVVSPCIDRASKPRRYHDRGADTVKHGVCHSSTR
jgi:Ca2+:H+ antiporter